MSFNYQIPDNHLNFRSDLAPAIRQTLLESTRDEWPEHSRYQGKAEFFLDIHSNILNGSKALSDGFEKLLDVSDSIIEEELKASRLTRLGQDLIGYAHHHHEMEDRYYFPVFKQLYSEMENAIALLDGDHLVLDSALDKTTEALSTLINHTVNRDTIARAYDRCRVLDSIISRHLWDEEEIIIPIFLESA